MISLCANWRYQPRWRSTLWITELARSAAIMSVNCSFRDLDVDQQFKEICGTICHFRLIYCPVPANNRRQRTQAARRIGQDRVNTCGVLELVRAFAFPRYVEPPFGRIVKGFESLAVDCMNRHTLASCHDADDPVARSGWQQPACIAIPGINPLIGMACNFLRDLGLASSGT